MDWVTMVGLLLTGGIGTSVVNQLLKGWEQRSKARGSQQGMLDALRRSRLWWMEATYRLRRAIIVSGAEPPPMDETEDPYLVYEAAEQLAGRKEMK